MTKLSTKEKLDLDFNEADVLKTKRRLRATEYYGLQETFDNLYADSKAGKTFNNLLDLITSEENILLAFRIMKKNTGGVTPGVDNKTIDYLKEMTTEKLVQFVQDKLRNYTPKSVKRVYIPKPNGKKRPLGIPCIGDRLVQQCIKQVLEPICEAKFHHKSFGFRPERSTEHAIANFMKNINQSSTHYIVDIDIKGFFDNVNHSKLLKQMWSLGIRDKNLLCIVKKCLQAPIVEELDDGKFKTEYPTKGTPQGGILSPLLSNIVLNELDWWVSDQWETFKSRNNYEYVRKSGGGMNRSNKYRALRKTNLKEGYLVRYADDFKICCKHKEDAERWFHATTQWMKERLHLDYSPDKSKITNLKKSSSEFLGLRFKVKPKGKKWVVNSHMTAKAKDNAVRDFREQIKKIKKTTTVKNVNILNAKILGRHNYYSLATHIGEDMHEIYHRVNKTMYNRLNKSTEKVAKKKVKNKHKKKYEFVANRTYQKFYGNYNYKPTIVAKTPIFPILGVKTRTAIGLKEGVTPYSEAGRNAIHSNLRCVEPWELKYLIENPVQGMSAEYNDNRISLYTAQWGACALTGMPLSVKEMECHHKIPKHLGGDDKYSNLTIIRKDVHKLIHATKQETIDKYIHVIKSLIGPKFAGFLKRLNALRDKVGNQPIEIT